MIETKNGAGTKPRDPHADLWRAFLEADERAGELYFAADDGDATQDESDAANQGKLRLVREIITAQSRGHAEPSSVVTLVPCRLRT
jgi:hypothetical protein